VHLKIGITWALLGALALPAAAAGTAGVEGPVWRLTALQGMDGAALPTGPKSVSAQFKDGRVSGFSGCNRFFGAYSWKNGQLVLGPLAGSMMACEPAAMKLESAFHHALAGSFRPVVADGRLRLDGPDGGTRLAFAAEPPPALDGLRSSITGFNNGRQAVTSPIAGTTIDIAFKDGVLRGFSGCNTFRARYRTEGDSIAVGQIATTRRQCNGEGVMQQEREFLAALKSTTTWGFSGALLDMHRADGERTLMGTRESD